MGQHTNQAPNRTAQASSSTAPQTARTFTRNEKVPTAIVIGGGPSGLISARRLAAAGMRVTLLEQRHHLGGAVGAHEVGGLLLDSGAESFATRSPIVSDLVKELGLGDQIVTPNSYGSWLYLPQGARRTPSTGIMGIPGNVNDKSLIPVIGKKGLRRAQVDKFLPISAGENAKTLGELVRIRMGQKVLDNLVAPVVSGVYSTHPDKLDVDATIPGLRAALRKHRSLAAAAAAFRSAAPAGSQVAGIIGGMNQLSERLVEELYEAHRHRIRRHRRRPRRIHRPMVHHSAPHHRRRKHPPLRRLPGSRNRWPDRSPTYRPARLHGATRPGARPRSRPRHPCRRCPRPEQAPARYRPARLRRSNRRPGQSPHPRHRQMAVGRRRSRTRPPRCAPLLRPRWRRLPLL